MQRRRCDDPFSGDVRRGWKWLESLTAIGILAALFALLAPAVQQARQAGFRVERANWRKRRFLGETTSRPLPIQILFIGDRSLRDPLFVARSGSAPIGTLRRFP